MTWLRFRTCLPAKNDDVLFWCQIQKNRHSSHGRRITRFVFCVIVKNLFSTSTRISFFMRISYGSHAVCIIFHVVFLSFKKYNFYLFSLHYGTIISNDIYIFDMGHLERVTLKGTWYLVFTVELPFCSCKSALRDMMGR